MSIATGFHTASTTRPDQPEPLALFHDKWTMRRPYAADDYAAGVYTMDRAEALRHRHVQTNSTRMSSLIVMDIDRPDGVMRALDGNRGIWPNWLAENPGNGHVHAVWALTAPVPRTEYARRKPLAFLDADTEGIRRLVDGDPAYSGLLMKNPTHQAWNTMEVAADPYSLDQLRDELTGLGFMPPTDWRKRTRSEPTGVGRNVDLFEIVRKESYRAVRRFFGDSEGLAQEIELIALQANVDTFPDPLPAAEVRAMSRSIHKWITTRSKMWRDGAAAYEAELSRRQAMRGRKGSAVSAAVRTTKAADKAVQAQELRVQGLTHKQIADVMGVSTKTVQRYLK